MNVRVGNGKRVHERWRTSLYTICGVGGALHPTDDPPTCKKCLAIKEKEERREGNGEK